MEGRTGAALTEEDIEVFITKLKAADTDKKVDQIQFFGLKLEQTVFVPVSTLDALTLTISPLLKSPSQLLVTSILNSFIPFYVPLLPTSPPTHLQIALTQYLPVLLDKLNDPKERTHTAARICISLFGKRCYEAEPSGGLSSSVTAKGKEKEGLVGFWERNVKDTMGAKGWRGKVEVMKMLLSLRQEEKSRLSLKPWLAPLVELLEDSDGNVRDQARETVVALLAPSSTPPAARMELKKLLQARNVRKTIADGIIHRIFAGDGQATAVPVLDTAVSAIGSEDVSRSGAATPVMTDEVEVVYVASGKDLENEFASMVPHFEGKETEHNWLPREKAMMRIRGLLRGNAHTKHPESFYIGLKSGVAEGMAKTLTSLRTTVAQQACAAVQELPEYLGGAFDPFVENLLPVLGKMAGFTKKIIADKSQKCVTSIITHTTVHPRLFVAHISAGVAEKNIQTRQFSTAHLKTFLDIHGRRSKSTIETTSAVLDSIEAAVKKGLADVNPQVRDLARAAFWSFSAIWPAKGQPIADSLDGTARKQLDKANPHTDGASNGAAVPAAKPATKRAGPSSAMAAMLAEKRKAKAAELAAGRAAQEHARTVSSPVPSSPSIQQQARSTSSQYNTTSRGTPLNRSDTSPRNSLLESGAGPSSPSPSTSTSTPKTLARSPPSGSRDLLSRSRSGSLSQSHARSPTSSHGSPVVTKSPLRQSDVPSGSRSPGSRSPGSSSSTSGIHLRTPVQSRMPLPSDGSQDLGVFGIATTPQSGNLIDLNSAPTRSVDIDPELKAQAEQAESYVQELLDVGEDGTNIPLPITPARPATNGSNGSSHETNGQANGASSSYLLKTPLNRFMNGSSTPSRRAWEDSPRPEAMTPLLFAQLKEKKHERTWWLKRQELMDRASPLKSKTPDPASAIMEDIQALESGSPALRNLQKLALFAESHPLIGDPEDIQEAERIWKEGKAFDRIFDGLTDYLSPERPLDLLEQGLVLLWEMVRNQWILFEDRDDALVDALFRLRACSNIIIHESVNSLISLLCEVSEALFFSSVLQSALSRYLASHPPDEPPKEHVWYGDSARSSGYLFGLTALGRCVLKMPREVVRIEIPRLAPLISDALAQKQTDPRKAANMLIMAVQAIMGDAQETMSMLDLTDAQRNMAFYMFEKNKLWTPNRAAVEGEEGQEDRAERVKGEMDGLLGKGARH